MKTKRFSVLQLILAVLLTAVVLTGGGLLALRAVVGQGGLALLEGLFLVHTRFVGDYDTAAVVDAALEGMVDGLGDRWSYYLTAEEYEAQNQRRKNQYVGIGVTVNYEREEGLLILEVTEGSPAAQAGLLAGELITAVDGQSLAGEARYDGADRIRGEAGSTLSLEVRAQTGQTRTVEVRRAALDSDPVEYELLEGQVGYVKLSNFYENSARRLEAAVTALQEQGARALVFDMRDNGGGYLTELTDMLDFLLNEGPIFISRDRQGHETVTESDADCVDLPMAVLVNANTYSAAEFFAAELQERGVAVLVGEPTQRQGLFPADLSAARRQRHGPLHRGLLYRQREVAHRRRAHPGPGGRAVRRGRRPAGRGAGAAETVAGGPAPSFEKKSLTVNPLYPLS